VDTPTVLTVFGATGDLMTRKIVPSLAYLAVKGRLPERFRIVGWGRRGWDDALLREHIAGILETYAGPQPEGDARAAFLDSFIYHDGTFDDTGSYLALADRLGVCDAEWGVCSNKLFYLAVPPERYRTILGNLVSSGLTSGCSDGIGFTRVLVEKPFGSDAESAQELDEYLASLFAEEQIYRIDHYLAKEMLQGILSFRFSNSLFEPAWSAQHIERIDIRLRETIGVEKRGVFYDGVGALRDVGQNHLLQMLALVTMEQPVDLSAEAIRAARLAFLETLAPLSAAGIATRTFRAQHEGYREIVGVAPDSETETYFRVETTLAGPRWGGVPVTMESGKRMGPALKEVAVTFRRAEPCLCSTEGTFENVVTFRLEPEEKISIRFWAKRPGLDAGLEPREFTFFLYEHTAKVQYVEEYAKLLLDAIAGDQTLYVSTGEVAAMWRFIDPIYSAWADGAVPLESYVPDSADVAVDAALAIGARAGMRRPEIGVVGLGKMGAALARNLLQGGWRVVGYNRTTAVAEAMESEGLVVARTLAEVVAQLTPPRVVWVMVPAGAATEAMLLGPDGLASVLEPGDIVIDGGNSFWRDTRARAPKLAEHGLRFLDVGTSGGPGGARNGACLMVGGEREDFERLVRLWQDLSVPGGFAFFDGHGAGHFVKMVHNGIEYGMMQAIAEGFTVLEASDYAVDLSRAAEVYNRGSVIESRLVGWLAEGFEVFGQSLEGVAGSVGHTGEGAWTIETAETLGVEHRVIRDALEFRLESEDAPSYTGQLLQAMRNRFGGHAL
jgi:glucose-6-phosphate 1-dehydrogenase